MVSILKHMTVRLWATLFIGGFTGVLILPVLRSVLNPRWSVFPATGFFVTAFIVIGWGFNRMGINRVERLIREASAWERDRMHDEAENAFQKAIAIFDSFLFSPGMKKKHAGPLAARLARFYLARAVKDNAAENFLLTYLRSYPEDEVVAEYWLQQIALHRTHADTIQDLAARIGRVQPENPKVQNLLARYYLSENRTDFQALQTYRRVLDKGWGLRKESIGKLAGLLSREGRADEWAFSIYLLAYASGFNRPEILNGVAACAYWLKDSEPAGMLLKKARELLESLDEALVEKMREGFNPPIPRTTEKEPGRMHRVGRVISDKAHALKKIARQLAGTVRFEAGRCLSASIRFIRHAEHARTIFKWTAMGLLILSVVILIFSTLQYLIQSKSIRNDAVWSEKTASVTDRFTIQVAAYLKPEHAERYAAQLKKNGLDVFWTKAQGSRKTWYQVRVSHFPDKAAARAYGEHLKSRGIIDDFYVANYTPTSMEP